MKWVLCVLVVGCGAAAGWLKARSFENRVLHLRDLQGAIRLLEAEMKYRRTPMPELLSQLGERSAGLAGGLFARVGARLLEDRGCDFSVLWEAETEAVYGESALTEADLRVLRDLGLELGKTDMDNQEGLFREAAYRLLAAEKEAEEEGRTKGKMYKGLGLAAGAATVVLLI